jgi:hypothetical protein
MALVSIVWKKFLAGLVAFIGKLIFETLTTGRYGEKNG